MIPYTTNSILLPISSYYRNLQLPAPELSHRLQSAVLWAVNGYDTYGVATVGTPIEINVRWKSVRKEVLGPQGNPIGIDAIARVDRKIHVGSIMWLGTLNQWFGNRQYLAEIGNAIPAPGSSGQDTELMQVINYNETVDLKGRYYSRVVNLMHYKNTLPGS
jgi:hypothetical protein